MKRFESYNANPINKRVGDCTVRAISKALGQSWEYTYLGLCLEGFCRCDMPTANNVFGAYLRRKEFERYLIDADDPDNYTVDDFCRDHPQGIFVLAISGHVVAVEDGKYFDSWDSGNEVPIFYWKRKDK